MMEIDLMRISDLLLSPSEEWSSGLLASRPLEGVLAGMGVYDHDLWVSNIFVER